MNILRKQTAHLPVRAFFFAFLTAFSFFAFSVSLSFPDTAAAADTTDITDLNVYRILKYYTADYEARDLTKSQEAALGKTASKNPADAVRLSLWNYKNRRADDAFSAASKAAAKNDPDGILLQGIFYLTETGTKEKSKGASRIVKAARDGHPVAQYLLASMYEEGRGVSRKNDEAENWYASAAKQGINGETMRSEESFRKALASWRKGKTVVAAAKTTAASAPASTHGEKPKGETTSASASKPDPKPTSGQKIVMNRVVFKSENPKMPDPNGVSLTMVQNAWDRLRKVTKIDAWLIYDDEDILNAYMTKNEKGEFVVVVYRGLMKIFRTEDEIAGVLGHESAHAVRGHLEKGRNQQIGINVAANVLSSLLGSSVADIAIGAGAELAKSGYSREAEVEADDYGTEYAAKAGYTPYALYNSVKRMAEAGAVTPPSGFNSHPPTERRMKRLKDKAEYWEKKLTEN